MALPVEVLAMASTSRVASRLPFPPEFFTPSTSSLSRKGKERSREAFFPATLPSNPFPHWSVNSRYPIICSDEEGRMASRTMSHEFMTKWDPPPIHMPITSLAIKVPRLLSPFLALPLSQIRHYRQENSVPESPLPGGRAALMDQINAPGPKFNFDRAYTAFEKAQKEDVLRSIPINSILVLTMKLTIEAEKDLYDPEGEMERLKARHGSILRVLDTVRDRVKPASALHLRYLILRSRALSLGGDFTSSVSILHEAFQLPFVYEEQGRIWEAFKPLLVAVWRYKGAEAVLDCIVEQWLHIGSFLSPQASVSHHSSPAAFGKSLRSTAFSLLHIIDDPVSVLAARQAIWSDKDILNGATVLIEAYLARLLPLDAFSVLQFMSGASKPVPVETAYSVVRGLAMQDMFRAANILFATLPRDTDSASYLATALYLAARQGDSKAAHEYFNELSRRQWTQDGDITSLLHSYATNGDVGQTARIFDHFFPVQPNGDRQPQPNLLHLNVLLYSYAQNADAEGIDKVLVLMSQLGLSPDIYSYNIILKCFALRGDMASLAAVFAQMRKQEIKPTSISYTTVITVLAQRRNPQAAEYIFRRALAEGIDPDRRMLAAIMEAHVAAGSWKGVIRVFDFLRTSPQRLMSLTVNEYNLVLKAYLFIGAPFFLLARLFTKMEQFKLIPDHVTYSLMIQSASESGMMQIASGIFKELIELEKKEGAGSLITAGMCTMIMSGFLAKNQHQNAKAVYDDMLARGLRPTANTYATILRMYASSKTDASLQRAENFVQSLTNEDTPDRPWDRPRYGRPSSLSFIYEPLLKTYAEKRSSKDVLRLYDQYIQAGGEPDLGSLANVLMVHRNEFNCEAAAEVWEQIYELGKSFSNHVRLFPEDPVVSSQQSNRTDILSIPLSFCIDALSAGGMHSKVADIWYQYQADGFIFSASNWNHLIVALVRAGEVSRAVEVVHRVVLPYQRMAYETHSQDRDTEPSSPLSFEVEEDDDYDYDEPQVPPSSTLHVAVGRRHIRKKAKPVSHIAAKQMDEDDDFVHPLYLMHQLSPNWNRWRVHKAACVALLKAVEQLEMEKLVLPLQPAQHRTRAYVTPEQAYENKEQARSILRQIYQDYGDAMEVIDAFRAAEQERLGTKYWRKYKRQGKSQIL